MKIETVSEDTLKREHLQVFPVNGTTGFDITNVRLGFLVHDVSRLRRNLFDQLMRPLGVTRSQWWVIAHLSRRDGMKQTELAGLLDIGKVTLGGLVDRLETGGWVERRVIPGDRRVKQVYLTGKAQNLISDMQAIEQVNNQDLLKDFTESDRRALSCLLARVKRNLLADATGHAAGYDEAPDRA